jgi:anionic cell wall polymer biosynthesis LytR-Cps2A-Psr (LCP) family protein
MTNQATDASEPADANQTPGASEASTLIRKRKRKRPQHKRLRIAAIVAAVVVCLGGVATFAIMNIVRSGESAAQDTMQEAVIQTADDAVSYDEGKTVSYNGHTYALNENMVSIVIIGFDRKLSSTPEQSVQADAVMVLALDTQTGKATAIGVPRDSMVEVGRFLGDAFIGLNTMQLCLAYSYGDGGAQSCEYTAAVVSRTLYSIPMNYYYALDQSGIGPLNDAIGGVALTPLQTIPSTNIVEGQDTVLFGNNAYSYVQWRDTSILNSSLDRQARQVQYIQAFASQALQLSQGSVGTLLDLYNTVGNYTITNLSVDGFSYLASTVLSSGITSLEMVTLTGEMVQGELYAEYYLDKKALYETVLDVYYRPID